MPVPSITEDRIYPAEVPDVKTGMELLSQHDCIVAMDELMSRRGHPHKDLAYLVTVLRRDRACWGDARDAREMRREEEEDV